MPEQASPIMPPDCEAPFVRAEVSALIGFLKHQAKFTAKRAFEAKDNQRQVLEGVSDRYARAAEGLSCLADVMPETPDEETLKERAAILTDLEKEPEL